MFCRSYRGMKKWIMRLVLVAVLAVPSFCLAAISLRIPNAGQTIYTEWQISYDGIPVSIEDGGPYNLGGGKNGTSVIISGLSAVGAKGNGDVYIYSPKKNEFEKKKSNAEKDKDSIRLVFRDLPETAPYRFPLPRTSTTVIFPTVWVCFDPIKGNPEKYVYLDVHLSEAASIHFRADRYETINTSSKDEEIISQYDSDGKLIEAKYSSKKENASYEYFYRWKTTGYSQYEIMLDEIHVFRHEMQALKWKDGAWSFWLALGTPEESSIPKDVDFEPCKIVGGPVLEPVTSDPDDLSWIVRIDTRRSLPAIIPAIAGTPPYPYCRYEMLEDGTARLTVEGMNMWGMKEEDLGEWTRFDVLKEEDISAFSPEELELMLAETGADFLEWRKTGESNGDGVLTMYIPPDTDYGKDYYRLFAQRKDGTICDVYYDPAYGFEIALEADSLEYHYYGDGNVRLYTKMEDGKSVDAYYDLSDGRLIKYTVYTSFPDGREVDYIYTCNDSVDPPDYWLCHITCTENDESRYYTCHSRDDWYTYLPGNPEETSVNSLPEELIEICVPVSIDYP